MCANSFASHQVSCAKSVIYNGIILLQAGGTDNFINLYVYVCACVCIVLCYSVVTKVEQTQIQLIGGAIVRYSAQCCP